MTSNRVNVFAAAVMALSLSSVGAAEMDAMPGMDHGKTKQDSAPGVNLDKDMGDMGDMGQAGGMTPGSMQGGSAPADARDPHAYSDGYGFGDMPRLVLADEHSLGSLLVSRLESVNTDDNSSATYDTDLPTVQAGLFVGL